MSSPINNIFLGKVERIIVEKCQKVHKYYAKTRECDLSLISTSNKKANNGPYCIGSNTQGPESDEPVPEWIQYVARNK